MNTEPVIHRDRPMVDLSLLVIRVIVGAILFVHGAQKVFGWFGGKGLDETVKQMDMGIVGYLVSIGECFGGAAIVLGFLSRFSALSNLVIMIGAIALVHGKNGFFVSNPGIGYEYNLALIGLLLPIVLAGPGRYALGRCLFPKTKGTDRPLGCLE